MLITMINTYVDNSRCYRAGKQYELPEEKAKEILKTCGAYNSEPFEDEE